MLFGTALLALGVTPAVAETVSIPFDPPANVRMFRFVRYLTATARSKDGCDAAMKDAVAEIAKKMDTWKMETLVSYVNGKDFVPTASVTCELSGKNSVVALDALAVKAGDAAAYTTIPAVRVSEIVQSLVTMGFNAKGQLMELEVVESGGELYLKTPLDVYGTTFGADDNTNDRAVVLFREAFGPTLVKYAEMLHGAPEIHGAAFSVSATRVDKEATKSTEIWRFEVPTDTIVAFRSGNITEQGVVDASRVFRDNARIDISMVDADD